MAKKSPRKLTKKKKPCACKGHKKEPIKNDIYRSFIAYQSSNHMTEGEMHCWQEFIQALAEQGNIPYIVFQTGTPPCIPTPGRPCPKTDG